MDLSGDKTGQPFDYLRKIISQEMINLGVAIPAVVESFNPETQEIEAIPVIRRRLRAEDGSLTVEDRPKQIKIPLCTPYVRQLGFSLTMPISPGDNIMLIVQDRGIDLWQETGAISDPPDTDEVRSHHYVDVVYIPGPIALPDAIEDYQIDSAELRNRTRSCAIQIWDDKAQVRAPLTNKTDWTAGGSVETFAVIDIEEDSLVDNNHTAGGDMTNLILGDISSSSLGGSITETAALGHTTNTPLSIKENAGSSIEETSLGSIKNDAGTSILLDAGTTITLDAAGKITIDSFTQVEIIAPLVTVTAATVNMTGNLNVTGTVTAAGFSGPASSAASFTNGLSTPTATINGIAHENHKHNETGTVTGTPIAGP